MFYKFFDFVAGDPQAQAQIYSVIASIVLAIVAKFLSSKARILWGRAHQNHFMIKGKDGNLSAIVTANYTISNVGRATAKEIEVSFNWQPEHYEVYPHIEYTTLVREDGRFIIKIPRISASQSVSVAIINAGNESPNLTHLGIDEGSVKEIALFPQRIFPKPLAYSATALMLVGIMTCLYWMFRIVISAF